MRILVVEDEKKVARALQQGLEARNYEVTLAYTGEEGFFLVNAQTFDLLILDLMLPGRNGLEILATLRRQRLQTPVLILTARDALDDRVRGLDEGADDYLIKPCALDELIARIQALLRRSTTPAPAEGRLSFGDVALDTATWTVYRGGEALPTTAKEFRLLKQFLENPGRVLTREDILSAVWGEDAKVESNVIDAHIANLRLKLESGDKPRLIHTVRGVGYVLKEP